MLVEFIPYPIHHIILSQTFGETKTRKVTHWSQKDKGKVFAVLDVKCSEIIPQTTAADYKYLFQGI